MPEHVDQTSTNTSFSSAENVRSLAAHREHKENPTFDDGFAKAQNEAEAEMKTAGQEPVAEMDFNSREDARFESMRRQSRIKERRTSA